MPFVTKRQPLSLSAADKERLEDLRRSRSAQKRQVLHAAILLDSANGMSDSAVAVANGVNRHTVALCLRKFLQFGMDAALGELPRPGKSRRIPDDAIALGVALCLSEAEGSRLLIGTVDLRSAAEPRAETLLDCEPSKFARTEPV